MSPISLVQCSGLPKATHPSCSECACRFGDGVQVLCYRGITFRMVEFRSTVHRVAANLPHQEQAVVHMPVSEYGGAQVMSMMHPQGHHALKQPAMTMELTRQSMRIYFK
ncbi:hypothetical protein ES332_D05G039500v1 [Gossypium tomentosum]|uniref:Uncharacterized protein n=1 Tax=Gossypium tomentosum TaxID=34277 RepID=A0A5D2KQS6_GOSTO|nr:hypothetical protein ES332_D05G039500v1 [Gossypium tomentosum]